METELLNNRQPILAAVGNPLLDLCVRLADDTVLKQFGLANDGQKEVTAQEQRSLVDAIHRLALPEQWCAGGCALNTLRVIQWLVECPNYSVFFGAVGKDEAGKHLKQLVSKCGVATRFVEHTDQPTGSSVALIHGNFRTLVAHLGAADVYRCQDFTDGDKHMIENVSLVYIESFFLSHSAPVVWEIIKLCKTNGVGIAINLSGSYLFEKHSEAIIKCTQYANVVFGNESEYQALSKAMGFAFLDVKTFVVKVCEMGIEAPHDLKMNEVKPMKMESMQILGKIVVTTRGDMPVICAQQGKGIFETRVLPLSDRIKDTTGAGDAFVAGFLKAFLEGYTLNDCVMSGCYASSEIIQQIGCNPPDHRPLALTLVREMFSFK